MIPNRFSHLLSLSILTFCLFILIDYKCVSSHEIDAHDEHDHEHEHDHSIDDDPYKVTTVAETKSDVHPACYIVPSCSPDKCNLMQNDCHSFTRRPAQCCDERTDEQIAANPRPIDPSHIAQYEAEAEEVTKAQIEYQAKLQVENEAKSVAAAAASLDLYDDEFTAVEPSTLHQPFNHSPIGRSLILSRFNSFNSDNDEQDDDSDFALSNTLAVNGPARPGVGRAGGPSHLCKGANCATCKSSKSSLNCKSCSGKGRISPKGNVKCNTCKGTGKK